MTPGSGDILTAQAVEITPIKYDIAGNFSSDKAYVNIGGSQE